MNSSQLLSRNARKYPKHEAVVSREKQITYKELDRLVNQFGNALRTQGVKKGEKVALFLPNVEEFVISYFAAQRIEAIVVPINVKLTARELEYILEHADVKVLIAHDLVFEAASKMKAPSLKIKTGGAVDGWFDFQDVLSQGEETTISCNLKEDDESTILYTSGTTGSPKVCI